MSAVFSAPVSAQRAASDLVSIDHPGSKFHIAMVVPPYFDVPPKAYGGVEAVVADLVDSLVDRGHRVTLIGAGEPGTKGELVPVWDRTDPERPIDEVLSLCRAVRSMPQVAIGDHRLPPEDVPKAWSR